MILPSLPLTRKCISKKGGHCTFMSAVNICQQIGEYRVQRIVDYITLAQPLAHSISQSTSLSLNTFQISHIFTRSHSYSSYNRVNQHLRSSSSVLSGLLLIYPVPLVISIHIYYYTKMLVIHLTKVINILHCTYLYFCISYTDYRSEDGFVVTERSCAL